MTLTVLLGVIGFGIIVLLSTYKLFAPKPDRVDDPDTRFGYGPDDMVGDGD